MPLPKGVRYRTVETPKGPVRLAFKGGRGNTGGQVVEAKNLKSGATHSAREFAADRRAAAKRKAK